MSEIHINDIMSFICIYMYICIYLYSRCSITGNCYIESVNSLSWEAGGPQAAGGNKTANGRFFFFFFLFSANPVLSWRHLFPPELTLSQTLS